MKLHKFFPLITLYAMLAWSLSAQAATNDILEQIPDDANGVLVIHSMADAGHIVRGDLAQMGLPVPETMFNQFLANMGLNNGVREGGSMAFIDIQMSEPKEDTKTIGRPYVLLLPANDPKAMLANLHPTAPQQGISIVTLPNQAESGYVAIVGSYIALAQDRTVLLTFLAHKGSLIQLPPPMRMIFDNDDVVFYINVPAVSAKWSTYIEQAHAALQGLALLNTAMTKEQRAFETNKLQLFCDGLKQYLHDTQAALFTVRLNEQGIRLGITSFFKPDTALAKVAAAQRALPPVNLDLLPAGEYLAAGAAVWDGATAGDLLDKVFNQLIGDADLAALVPQLKTIAQMDKQIMTQALRARFVIFTPPQNDLKKFNGCMIVDSNDPEKLQILLSDAFRQPVIQTCPDVATTIQVEKNADVIKGVPLTKITLKMTPQPETSDHPRTAQMKRKIQILTKAQGPKGFTMYTGVTQKKLVILFGSDLKVQEAAIVAVQTINSAALTKQVVGNTPGESPVLPGAASVLYLPVERWMNLTQATIPSATATAPATAGAARTTNNVFLPLIFSKNFGKDSAGVQLAIPQALLIDLGQCCAKKCSWLSSKQDAGK